MSFVEDTVLPKHHHIDMGSSVFWTWRPRNGFCCSTGRRWPLCVREALVFVVMETGWFLTSQLTYSNGHPPPIGLTQGWIWGIPCIIHAKPPILGYVAFGICTLALRWFSVGKLYLRVRTI